MGFANVTDGPTQPVLTDQRAVRQERSVIRGKTVIAHRTERPEFRQTKSGYFVFEKLKSRRMDAITRVVFAITYIVGRSCQYRPWFVQIRGAFRPYTAWSLGGTYERDLAPFALMARARAPGFAFHSTGRHCNIIIFFVPNIIFLVLKLEVFWDEL